MIRQPICDYNYKCLELKDDNRYEYKDCPYSKDCDIQTIVIFKCKKHYNNHLCSRKIKTTWDKAHPAPSVGELRALYKESLRSGFNCVYCGIHMTLESHYMNSSTFEHVTPRSLGGKSDKTNIKICCKHCNEHKTIVENRVLVSKNIVAIVDRVKP